MPAKKTTVKKAKKTVAKPVKVVAAAESSSES